MIGFVVNDTRPENEKDLEVGVASTIVDKMKPHQVNINNILHYSKAIFNINYYLIKFT